MNVSPYGLDAKTIEDCSRCLGSGLEPCEHNRNVSAKKHHRYILCKKCDGKGLAHTTEDQ